MRITNITAILRITKKYLDGEMSRIDYKLNLPYEVKKRYQNMCKTDRDYADILYFYLIECGTDRTAGLFDELLYKLIQRQYLEILKSYTEENYAPNAEQSASGTACQNVAIIDAYLCNECQSLNNWLK